MKYSDLLTVETQASIEARIRTAAQSRGSSPTTWKPKSVSAVLVYAFSYVLAQVYELINYFARGAAFSESTPPTLAQQWANSQYATPPLAAVFAAYELELTCEAGQGPYTLTEFRVATSWGTTFTLSGELVLESGSSAVGLFVCDVAGLVGNVDVADISIIQLPQAGVALSGEGTQTVSGAEAETVSELYARCIAKWAGLGAASSEFVQNLCRTMDPTLTKVKTRVDSSTAGAMIIYLAQNEAEATDEQVEAVQAKIDGLQLFQAVTVVCYPADIETITLTGAVYCFPGRVEEAQAAVTVALAQWQAELSYGATLRASDYWRRLFGASAINYVDIAPDSEYTVAQWSIPVIQNDLTFLEG